MISKDVHFNDDVISPPLAHGYAVSAPFSEDLEASYSFLTFSAALY